jgi:hypothetical protein
MVRWEFEPGLSCSVLSATAQGECGMRTCGTAHAMLQVFGSLGHELFGTDWFCLDPHMCLFTPKSLQSLFTGSSLFQDVRTRTITRASGNAISRRRAFGRPAISLATPGMAPEWATCYSGL